MNIEEFTKLPAAQRSALITKLLEIADAATSDELAIELTERLLPLMELDTELSKRERHGIENLTSSPGSRNRRRVNGLAAVGADCAGRALVGRPGLDPFDQPRRTKK